MALEFRILGPLEVALDGRPVALGARRERMLLAVLLVHRGAVVSTDRIFEELYGERPPPTAASSLQNAVSKLRKALGAELIQTRAPGYAIAVSAETLDSALFERLVAEAPIEPKPRASALREALALWRGPPLADFTFEPFAQAEIARLDELRLVALEERVDADLACGEHTTLAGELRSLVAEHPFRERLRRQLMLALYAAGRQADALEAYREARRTFLEELGIEPSPVLRDLERAILEQDATLPAVAPAVAPVAAARPVRTERRQTVTVLFADIVHSTRLARSLDPEALREVTARYFAAVRRVVERHGGTVEKSVGDAVMAVFGVPRVHEDDALRAVRAGEAMLDVLGDVNRELAKGWGVEIEIRIGIATGEVVVEGAGELLATGEAVNLARSLEHLAGAGEILVGEQTWRLVRDAVDAELVALEPEIVDVENAWRVVGVRDVEPFARRLETPIVGRERELQRLRDVLGQAVADERAQLVTVLGPAGIGKTRLALAFAAEAAGSATVVTGHCPSFGDALTYWPLREIVQQTGAAAGEVGDLLDHGRAEEILPATRALFESLAEEGPLVVVLEDLHWAEPTFLELVEHLADGIRAAPVLLLCLARLDLVEERGDWAGGLTNATSLLLEPLSAVESEALVGALLGGSGLEETARAGVVEAAEGNPLFIEQLLSALVLGEAADELPPTIEALLAARLDRLGPGERTVVEAAAVAGREFSSAAVGDLLPGAAAGSIDRHLASLVRRELVRPSRSPLLGEEAFTFRHVLVREAAYRGTPKTRRATLHGSFAQRLAMRMPEQDELVGYHLEQAFLLQAELGPVDEPARGLAAEAGERLARAGLRAWKRGDVPAAVNLLERATSLLPGGERQRELLCELGLAFRSAGNFDRAADALTRALDASLGADDRRLEYRARIELVAHQLTSGTTTRAEELLRVTREAIPVFESASDDRSLGRAWLLAGHAEGALLCRNDGWRHAAERALDYYERAGWNSTTAISAIAAALYHGPTPVPDALDRCLALAAQPDSLAQASVFTVMAALRALEGNFDDARSLLETCERTYAELGHRADIVTSVGWARGEVELASGDLERAEGVLAEVCKRLEAMRAAASLATESALLADALYLQRRWDEALDWTLVSERNAAIDDLSAQCLYRGVRAKVVARRGEVESAESMAAEAVAIAEQTDSLNQHGKVLLDLSEVQSLASRVSDARNAAEAGLALYGQKGNAVGIAQARHRLAELAHA